LSLTPSITPGRITAIWRILTITARCDSLSQSELVQIAKNTSLRGGGLPVEDGVHLALSSELIVHTNDQIYLSDLGKEIVSLSDQDEPNICVFRKILQKLVLKLIPPWVVFVNSPFEELIISIPYQWRDVLETAGLLVNPLNDDVKEWWSSVNNEIHELDQKHRKAIGDAAENLTFKYEKERLIIEELPELSGKIHWVAKENDYLGFDISSFLGSLGNNEQKVDDLLMIEVKSTCSKSNNNLRFFLTKNEWTTAEHNPTNYFFYFWKGIDINSENIKGDGPYILPMSSISKYIPKDMCPEGEWTECRIYLSYEEIQTQKLN